MFICPSVVIIIRPSGSCDMFLTLLPDSPWDASNGVKT